MKGHEEGSSHHTEDPVPVQTSHLTYPVALQTADSMGTSIHSNTHQPFIVSTATRLAYVRSIFAVVSGIASILMVDYSSIFPTDDRPIIDFFTPLLANIS